MKTTLTICGCLKSAAVCVAVALILTAAAEGQSQSLDILRFTPPKSWTLTNKGGAVVISNIESAKNAFCVVTISSSRPSEGTPQSDFTKEWASQIVVPYKADAKPKSESQTDAGWTTTSAASPIEIDGIKSLALLTVISGYGRVATILSILNSD
ncbi:MAG TPA: hypothetical protein VHQ01_06085, partial [Pyrinomonadaceae bacterium]|nr:hypothetical protein [Pyrinomonadaceae bacterium]